MGGLTNLIWINYVPVKLNQNMIITEIHLMNSAISESTRWWFCDLCLTYHIVREPRFFYYPIFGWVGSMYGGSLNEIHWISHRMSLRVMHVLLWTGNVQMCMFMSSKINRYNRVLKNETDWKVRLGIIRWFDRWLDKTVLGTHATHEAIIAKSIVLFRGQCFPYP